MTGHLFQGVDSFLYLFQHCATKSMCEAVIEGMGSVWDKAADPERHPAFEESSKEAVIAWNAPKPYMPEAKHLIKRALDNHFGDKPWNFTHTDTQERYSVFTAGNSTLSALQAEGTRLPGEYYDVAPP